MTRWMVILGFAVALAAGYVAGLAWRPPPPTEERAPRERGSWLARELDLTPEQREQMKAIWSATARQGNRERWSRREDLRRQRDDAIRALIPAEQQDAYEQAHADYRAAVDAMEAQWRADFQQAVQKTRDLLTPAQREQYDRIMARHTPEGRSRSRSGDASTPRRERRETPLNATKDATDNAPNQPDTAKPSTVIPVTPPLERTEP